MPPNPRKRPVAPAATKRTDRLRRQIKALSDPAAAKPSAKTESPAQFIRRRMAELTQESMRKPGQKLTAKRAT